MPPTGLTVAGQSCTPTSSPGTVTATIAYRDGSSATGLGSVTVARPAGAAEGDVLLAFYVVQSDTLPTTPAGWTRLGTVSHSTAGSLTVGLYTRTASASDPSTWTWTSSVSNRSAAVTLAAYSGVDTAAAVNTGNATVGIGTSVTAPSLIPTVAGTRLVGAFNVRAATTLSPPASMTPRGTTTSTAAGTGTAAVSLGLGDEAHASTSDTGTRTATAAVAGDNIGVLLALAPKVTAYDGTITHQGSASGTGGATLSLTSPTTVQVGDLLLVGYGKRASAALVIETPAGWTRLTSWTAGTDAYRQTVFWRHATAADAGGATYGFTSSSTDNAAGVLAVYRGVDVVIPVLADSGLGVTGASVAAPSVTPGRADARLVGIFGVGGTGSTGSTPAGMSARAAAAIGTGKASERIGLTLVDQPWPSDGATGSRTSTSADAAHMVGQLIALKAHSVPQVSLAWTPSASSYAEGYDVALTSEGSPVASAVLTPATTSSYDTGTLTPGGSYQVAVTTRAQSWRSTPAELDLTVTTQC